MARGRGRGRRRRNPFGLGGGGGGMGGRGLVGQVFQGGVDAFWLLAGEAGSNIIVGYIPIDKTGPMGAVAKVGAAVATAWVLRRFVGTNAAKMALAGGLATVIREPLRRANIPMLSQNLGDEPGYYAVGAGAYPHALPGVGAYPGTDFMGDEAMVSYGQ